MTYDLRARLNKAPAGALGVYLAPGANALETADNVKKILEEAKLRFPPDMDYEITLDSTLPIKASMESIVHTLFEAIILVLIVVYIFLQSFRATIIPMLTVPVSLLGVFIAFPMLGFSVNTLTMFGLVLAIGIVVDDAIVVVEAVQHHIEHGLSPVDATRKAMQEVSGPVVAIALILCAVFVPVAFMGGVTGRLYQQFAITIAVSVIFSAINALTLSPALSALLLRKPTPGRGPIAWFFRKFNAFFDWIIDRYGRIVGGLTRKATFSMLLLVIVCGGIWGLGKVVPGGFIPDEDKGYLFVAIELPEGASLQRSDEVLKQVEEIVGNTHGVRSALALSGMNILNNLNVPNAALMFIGLEDWEERKTPELHAKAIAAEWNKKFAAIPGARDLRLRSAGTARIRQRFRLHHAAPGPLRRQRRATRRHGQPSPGRRRQASGNRPLEHHLQSGHTAGEGRAGPRKSPHARRAGGQRLPNPASLSERPLCERLREIRPGLQGLPPGGTGIHQQAGRHREILRPQQRRRHGPAQHAGERHQDVRPQLRHAFQSLSSAEMMGAPAPGYSSAQALKAMEEVMATMPANVGYEWSGLTLQEKKSEGQAGLIFGMAIIFVFLLLAAQYESWSLPFAVLLSVPTVILGTMIGLLLRNFEMNVYAQVGLVMLIGLAAKNAILIVEFAKMKRDEGMPTLQAALEGAKLRLRPILMTSFAFILGCVPLMLATGSGAASRSTMGTGVVFGMTISTAHRPVPDSGLLCLRAEVLRRRRRMIRSPHRPDRRRTDIKREGRTPIRQCP